MLSGVSEGGQSRFLQGCPLSLETDVSTSGRVEDTQWGPPRLFRACSVHSAAMPRGRPPRSGAGAPRGRPRRRARSPAGTSSAPPRHPPGDGAGGEGDRRGRAQEASSCPGSVLFATGCRQNIAGRIFNNCSREIITSCGMHSVRVWTEPGKPPMNALKT